MSFTEPSTPHSGGSSDTPRSAWPATGNRPGIRERVRLRIDSEIDAQKDRAVNSLLEIADTVRRIGEPLGRPPFEPVAKHVRTAADRVERAAVYLRKHEVADLVDDLCDFARRQPMVFVGVGLVAGAVCGRFLKSSNAAAEKRPW